MKNLLLLFALFFSTGLWAQTKLVEKVSKKGDEIVIPYEKYELENGLTLIIHEDHSDPVVQVDVTYHVGSAREELQKSGFAHFFEHMMFQGSENVADEEHFKIVTEAGGSLNGSTNTDRTNYYETLPSNQLETALWLEADRMGFFLDAVTQEKFEIQRATVKNEKGQNYDNRPYGRSRELQAAALYPYGHPYSWLTIGKLEDLDRVDVDDLKSFFMRWYGPNNATLTIGGDVEPKEVVKLVEKYFGVIPRGPEVEKMELDAPVLESDRYVSYVDDKIRFPMLTMVFPTIPGYHPDEAPLDCLSDILGSGKSSYLYKKFVETQKAYRANAYHPAKELAGEFTITVYPFPGQSLPEIEKEIRNILEEFAEKGVSEEEVERFKAGREAGLINGLSSVRGKVFQLANYETVYGDANAIKYDLDRYLNFTKEDVMRVFNKYLKGKPAVVMSVLPDEDTEPAKPDNYEIPTEGDNPFPTTDYSGLEYKRPEGDQFDRSKRPELGENPVVNVPDFWSTEFDNGMQVIGTVSDEIPTVNLQLTLNGGQKLEARDLSKAGLASLTSSMMNEGTENYSGEAIQEELDRIGSNVSIYSGQTSTTVNISSLVKHLDRTLELAEEILMHPAFKEEDFERLKKRQLENIQQQEKVPAATASRVFQKLLYGKGHVYAVPTSGEQETVENITLEDVKNYYRENYSPSVGELVIVGDISQEEILSKLDFLKKWEAKTVEIPELPKVKKSEKTKLYLVDKANAPQSEIRIGYLTDLDLDLTGEFYEAYLMNYNLGGGFNSRINLNLREDKGWTYGARAGFYYDDPGDPIAYIASSGVKADATAGAVNEFMKEITNYQKDGITEDELIFMRKAIGQNDALRYESPWQKAGFLRMLIHYDLDKSYVDKRTEMINTITKKEIDELAKKYLDYNNMYILVVGDEASNLEELKELGYEMVKLDEKGEPKVVRP